MAEGLFPASTYLRLFARAQELFGERSVMDLAGLVGYYGFINITLKTFDVQLAPRRERLLPDLW